MKQHHTVNRIWCAVAGGLSGLVNGFFGAGGGIVLVPLLLNWIGLESKRAFATSVLYTKFTHRCTFTHTIFRNE